MLKRYPVGSEVPAAEWEGLRFANDAGLMSPRPLALDASGEWFGSPALVIDAIPGRPDVAPKDANAYVNDVATAMANIHATSVVNAEGVLLRSHSVDRWTAPDDVPDGLLSRPVARRVVAALGDRLPRADRGEPVLNHGDLHPGNLLWRRGRLTGVVDWSSTRLGPRWWELAYFRMELAVLADVRAADLLLERYEAILGSRSPAQPVWDLLSLYNGHRFGHLWLMGYREQGRRDLTLQTVARRLTRLAERSLALLG